ncbi:MAG: phosphate acyltransferase PlsX [Coriobacteriales bacterium]|nr:phosphate acyltransferase PlsX [Coriobacteriales bacterium]
MITVCVDAMGGDEPAEVVCEGIALALKNDEDLSVLVAGNEDVVVPFCNEHERAIPLVTTEVIGMEEHPAESVRRKKDSSIVRACAAVRAGDAQGFFSAGSTGAVFLAATMGIGRIRGIKRPCLASIVPGLNGHQTVALDLGANADARPEMIVQFAQMGAAFARVSIGVDNPRVALLSNGEEETKGSEMVLAYHKALAEADCGFVGNAEGTDILLGDFDVIVTDGFTGNVALKTLEGTAKFIMAMLKESVSKSVRAKVGALLLKPALKDIKQLLSGDDYGGAVLLGTKAPVFIGHGATSAQAVASGTAACAAAIRGGLVDKVSQALIANDE